MPFIKNVFLLFSGSLLISCLLSENTIQNEHDNRFFGTWQSDSMTYQINTAPLGKSITFHNQGSFDWHVSRFTATWDHKWHTEDSSLVLSYSAGAQQVGTWSSGGIYRYSFSKGSDTLSLFEADSSVIQNFRVSTSGG